MTVLLKMTICQHFYIIGALMLSSDKRYLINLEDKPKKVEQLEFLRKIMNAYSATTKTYTQLSLGSLVLSITFMEKVIGQEKIIIDSIFLLLSWICWLLAVLGCALYQYFAVRFVEDFTEEWGLIPEEGIKHYQCFNCLAKRPWYIYCFSLISFYFGAIFFTIFGLLQLKIT